MLSRKTSSSLLSSIDSNRNNSGIYYSPSPTSSPLGRSSIHDHYIKPVYPMYVTEYEDAYQWPTPFVYLSPDRHPSKLEDKSLNGKGEKLWNRLKTILEKLIKKGYEPNLLKLVSSQVEAKRFDSVIEYTYNHMLDVIKQPILEGGSVGVVSMMEDKDNESVVTYQLSCNVVQLCKEFVETIDAIKAI